MDGLLYGGGALQLGQQLVGGGAVLVYAFVVSGIIGLVVDTVMGFRIHEDHEISGQHLLPRHPDPSRRQRMKVQP